MNKDQVQQLATALLQELSDRGQIVEGGWRAYELLAGLTYAPEVQRNECRKAFFLGAQHLYACMIGMVSDDAEATQSDMERMEKLHKELQAFEDQLKT